LSGGGKDLSQKINRRKAIGKGVVGAIVSVGVIAGIGGYFAGREIGGIKTVTEVLTSVATTMTEKQTVTQTTTVTRTLGGIPETVNIGVLCDLSGRIGPVGSNFYKGALLAAKIANDSGGIAGSKVKVIVEDTKSEPQAALDATKKLIEIDGVQIIVGPITSVATLTIASYVNSRKVPIIATIATSPKITQLGDDYVFRVAASDVKATGAAAVDFFKANNINKLATFVVADDYGLGIEDFVKEQLGPSVVASIRIDPAKGDFRSELETLKTANPEAVLWILWPENARIVFRQAADLGVRVSLSLSGNTLYNPVLFEDQKVADFMVDSNLHVINEKVAKGTFIYDEFTKSFKNEFKEDPWEPGAKSYYDATNLAIMAIAKAGNYVGEQIKDSLYYVSQHYVGPSGFLAFDINGDRQIVPEQEIFQIVRRDGKYDFNAIAYWDPLTKKIHTY